MLIKKYMPILKRERKWQITFEEQKATFGKVALPKGMSYLENLGNMRNGENRFLRKIIGNVKSVVQEMEMGKKFTFMPTM